jgi:hypothetical protein
MGETSLILSKEAEKIAEEKQLEALEDDERSGLIEEYLNRLLPDNWKDMDRSERLFWLDDDKNEGTQERTQVSVMEIWSECFRNKPSDKKRADSDDITKMLLRLGWKRGGTMRAGCYGRQRAFVKSGNQEH